MYLTQVNPGRTVESMGVLTGGKGMLEEMTATSPEKERSRCRGQQDVAV